LGALFAADATVTLVTRIARGERWHHAHRSHAYQRLSRRWRAHQPVTLLAIAINLLWLAPLAWACQLWPDFAWLIVAIAYAPLLAGAFALGAGRPDGA
jgi:Fuc2NAc and GlcNAc transferase